MYQNRICRKPINRNPQFYIARSAIVFEKRTAYVESVCQVLIESRFGPGRVTPVIINLSDRPELEEAVFYDLTDDGMSPCYALSPQGRAGYQVIEAEFRKAKQMGLVGAGPNAHNSTAALTPNQGRGSP